MNGIVEGPTPVPITDTVGFAGELASFWNILMESSGMDSGECTRVTEVYIKARAKVFEFEEEAI